MPSTEVKVASGDEPRTLFGTGGVMDALRLPFNRSRTGEVAVAEAGVVGDRKTLSLGLAASTVLLICNCGPSVARVGLKPIAPIVGFAIQ